MLSGKSAFVHHVGLCNRVIRFSILLILFLIQITSCTRGPVPRSLLFDNDWLFIKGTIEGAEKPNYDDSAWRRLDLPHDWSIEDLPILNSPIDSTAVGGVNTGFFVGGTGWYRKHFNIPSAQKGKRLYLQFDGIYMNADVWLNGDHIGNHPYGYTSFYFDITSSILFGRENVLAVEVKNEGKNSRWYSGSGIYRHVWLIQTDPVHIAIWGVAVTTPTISKTGSQVRAMIKIKNQTAATNEITLISTVFDPNGRKKGREETKAEIKADSTIEVEQNIYIESPEFWSIETPLMHKIFSEVYLGSSLKDKVATAFGIREISFDSQNGFQLNGKTVLLKGGCMHHDNGPLGAAAYNRAEERRVELMKASGFNAIRCAHNPPSPAFLDACDRLGMLVIDESFDMWAVAKNPQDYHLYFDRWWKRDIESMVFRDRNHPSVIMWSIGNEVPERAAPEGVRRSQMMGDYIRKIDSSRPITSAVNGLNPDKDPFFATLDLCGYNYAVGGDHWQESLYEKDHKRMPNRIIYCAESYPLEAYGSWMAVLDFPYVIGDFVWTGFDYLGESSIGWLGYWQNQNFYPWSHAYCGDLDICGFKRPQSYYRDALWQNGKKPSIFVVPPEPSFRSNPQKQAWSKWEWHDVIASWNWKGHENKPFSVRVYNSSESVELFLNEKSLGKKVTNRQNEWIASWLVPYQQGILKASSYSGSEIIATSELHTAGEVKAIHLIPDRAKIFADGQDICYVTVLLLDSLGVRNPLAENLVKFEISGPGTIIAVGSSNPKSLESYKKPERRAYQGRCLVIVKSKRETGKIRLQATSNGLLSAQTEIETTS